MKKTITKHGISSTDKIHVFFFIVAPEDNNKLLLRILSRLMDITERNNFLQNILSQKTAREVKEYLLHNDRYISLKLNENNKLHQQFINHKIKNINFPKDILVALIERGDESVTPNGDTVLEANDVLTIIGKPDKLRAFRNNYNI
ncbi:MAG TPA: TrkA C-terminal domain-containing protein [Bacteroidales bacterium]|nr:TrkA C-terminal domain-containing protein [Bacteroidales bacterium]